MEYVGVRIRFFSILLITLCVGAVWYAVFLLEGKRYPQVTFFDVGQGDAIFVEAPNGNQILIDGGPGERVLSKVGRRLPFWDRSIDLVILTHPHADHISGLVEILKRYDIEVVGESGAEYESAQESEWERTIEEKHIRTLTLRAGDRIHIADGLTLDVLAPFRDVSGDTPNEIHDSMVVIRLSVGDSHILFTGDAEDSTERELTFFGMPIDADILKVGHHGSKTSTVQEFLETVSPTYAVVSSGRGNQFGHPHPDVVGRLKAFGVTILRTDEVGDIHTIFRDGGIIIK